MYITHTLYEFLYYNIVRCKDLIVYVSALSEQCTRHVLLLQTKGVEKKKSNN